MAALTRDPSGRRALIANRAAGTLSLFAIGKGTLSLLTTLSLGEATSPAQPIYLAKGTCALVTRDGREVMRSAYAWL